MIPLPDDNSTSILPYLTIGSTTTCVLVFFWQISPVPRGQKIVMYGLGVIPAALFEKHTFHQNFKLPRQHDYLYF